MGHSVQAHPALGEGRGLHTLPLTTCWPPTNRDLQGQGGPLPTSLPWEAGPIGHGLARGGQGPG